MRLSDVWTVVEETGSTQEEAARLVAAGCPTGVVLAHHQTAGHGKFDRPWHSQRGGSLTMSLVFADQAGHPRPWLLGMAVATAAAGAVHSQVQWPNDLTIEGKKVGGVLTQLFRGPDGRDVPVVGVGINLNISEFPAGLRLVATSLLAERGHRFDPIDVAQKVVLRVQELPVPLEWRDLAPVWALFDDTRGKRYRTAQGTELVAIGIGPQGELIGSHRGETITVMAADAVFGPEP
jgi:BirA family biotin operon repressor/biotin-[acetyl-CoA-carboxylase] ligase